MRMMTRIVLSLAAAVTGCGADPEGGRDSAVASDGDRPRCVAGADCDDGLFCNGVEMCDPGAIAADGRGCVPGDAPCPGAACDETTHTCAGCADADRDGHTDAACGGDDCDDDNAARFPGNVEVCDLEHVDEDCNPATLGHDRDADGAIDAACCNAQPDGSMACGDDCDDTRSFVNPGAREICNGADDDCNGNVDEGVATMLCRDADADLFGDPADALMGCPGLVEGYVTSCLDCDDSNPAVNPGAPEVCNGVDDNCNSAVDEGVEATLCRDIDGDLYGDPAMSVRGCPGLVLGYVMNCSDCDDANAAVRPGAAELCDGRDNDCNGIADDGVMTQLFYPDCDGDTFGDAGSAPTMSCGPTSPPSGCPAGSAAGWATRGMDCDDTRAAVYPGAPERCNGRDNDCNGITDDPGPTDAWCNDPSRLAVNVSRNICTGGACVIAECSGLYLDCNGGAGCETSGAIDLTNCGACSRRCGGCVSGVCLVDTIGLGRFHSCARRLTGAVACWGANGSGQLGDGTGVTRTTAVTVSSVTGARDVAGGDSHSCARTLSGAVFCWGNNSQGQLGDGTTLQRYAPVAVLGIEDTVHVSAGERHTCAVRAGGRVLCWGDSSRGQLGIGTPTLPYSEPVPVEVSGVTNGVSVAAGSEHTCVLRSNGTVACWGANSWGQLGDGTATSRFTPTTVVGVADAVEIAAGLWHTCARRASGAVLCWGAGGYGQLGDGALYNRATPTPVASLMDAAEISLGAGHSCARRATGAVLCWGLNARGQLGDGSTTTRMVPTPVSGLSDAVEVASGSEHSCARRASGTVACWGANSSGCLGDGTTTDRHTPVTVMGL